MNYNSILDKNWKRFALFACAKNSKKPDSKLAPKGFKSAKFGQSALKIAENGFNPAVALSMSNLIVFDFDFHSDDSDPVKEFEELENKLGKAPYTLKQKSASGKGWHLVYRAKGIINPIGKLSANIDIKYNGYILIAPSKIDGNQYEIIDGVDENGNFIIAELPQEWVDYINKGDKKTRKSTQKYTGTPKERKLLKKINIDKMFEKCQFLQYCKDKKQAEVLEEPMWHSMITVLAQIEGSDLLIHEFSMPYPKYSFHETQAKIEYARDFGYSQTCKYISESYPNVCKGCSNVSCDKMPIKAVVDNMAMSYEELKNSLELAQVREV